MHSLAQFLEENEGALSQKSLRNRGLPRAFLSSSRIKTRKKRTPEALISVRDGPQFVRITILGGKFICKRNWGLRVPLNHSR